MRTTKQLEKERVVISVEIPVELYYRMKFEGERLGFSKMSEYVRNILVNHFTSNDFNTEAAE